LAELGHLLKIDVGEALGMGLTEVQRRWFSTLSNVVPALESHEVIERGGKKLHWPAVSSVVGHWENIIDPLDTTWVRPNGTPYDHNEASVSRVAGIVLGRWMLNLKRVDDTMLGWIILMCGQT
jgi:hypothetical protein